MSRAQLSTVNIQTPDGTCDAYFARPEADGRYPAILFYMDAFGLRPTIADMVTHLAGNGYCVLAPNVFYRNGPAPVIDMPDMSVEGARQKFFAAVMPMMRRITPERAVRDAGAYLDFLANNESVAGDRFGATGYCMGGVLAMRTAAAYPDRIVAAASFHGGRLATDSDDSPHRLASDIRAELYFAHAENDQSMNGAAIARLEQALTEAGVPYRSEVYPGTQHGFTMADTPVFDADALARHWENLFDLFGRTLAAR
ncbi:dienelactone hydrolase family protein [Skermania sp. ID1734]|uniref:dienelactone hydrolase family protein n=1 Tax=Skermania sp. ID1734 TaxID=2597516 RepID=UPI00117EE6E8|nr:dienelactone hydrolase family protein [Skermania sp. ID1734]TSD97251.1 dienelactone hydrolase family protein [Skermania sp. ID1734]